MIKVYDNKEIPKGYQDTIKINKYNVDDVLYILVGEDNFTTTWEFVMKLGRYYTILSTITEVSFFVIFKDKK